MRTFIRKVARALSSNFSKERFATAFARCQLFVSQQRNLILRKGAQIIACSMSAQMVLVENKNNSSS